jgi:ribosomal protein S4
MKKKNTIYKPFYKHFIKLNKNVHASSKFLVFKKQKWKKLIYRELKKKKKVILFDQNIYLKPKYGFNFTKKFKFYLNLKQNLKFFYGKLSNKKFNNLYFKSKNIIRWNTIFNRNSVFILFFLERRLDIILYRTLWFDSIRSSQQAICHGKIFLNGKKNLVNSHLVKKGDLIQIHYSFYPILLKNINFQNRQLIVPKYLELNYKTFQFFIISDISLSKITYKFPFWLNLNKLFLFYI